MSIVVYWLSEQGPGVQGFADGELSEALAFAEAQRKARSAEGQPLHRPGAIWSSCSRPGVRR